MLFKEILPTVLNVPNDTVIQIISFLTAISIIAFIPFIVVLIITSYRTKTPIAVIITDSFGTSPIPEPYRVAFVLFSIFVIFFTLLLSVVILFYIIPFIAIFGYWLFNVIFYFLISLRS